MFLKGFQYLTLFALSACSMHGPGEKTPLSREDCRHEKEMFRCVEYVRNYDGDTITVSIQDIHPLFGDTINVRVAGIDAAELRTEDKCERRMAVLAKTYVENLLSQATLIHLQDVQRDKYFRVLAEVVVDGELLSEKLLSKNLAVPYDGGTKVKVDWCAASFR
jgi:endonuclease YncB( thermonuclease family)